MSINVPKWINENRKAFSPPVCNKLMHNTQTNVMFVGGPNTRKDYHIECGEELFYQIEGEMNLPIVEKGKHRTVTIREGEIFLLPARIPHSPQRKKNTLGLVIERKRIENQELDALRYYVEANGNITLQILFEEWFYCDNLDKLNDVIQRFLASEQYKTGKPIEGTNPPMTIDESVEVADPFKLKDWIAQNRNEIESKGKMAIYPLEKFQFQVFIYGAGNHEHSVNTADTWLWQLEGESKVVNKESVYQLNKDDSLVLDKESSSEISLAIGSLLFVCWQDPTKAV